MGFMKPTHTIKFYSENIPGDKNHKYEFCEVKNNKTKVSITFEKFPYKPYLARYNYIVATLGTMMGTYPNYIYYANILKADQRGGTELIERLESNSKADIFKLAYVSMIKLAQKEEN